MTSKLITNVVLRSGNKSNLLRVFFVYVLTFSPEISMASVLYENTYDGYAYGTSNCSFQCVDASTIGASAFSITNPGTIEQLRLTIWSVNPTDGTGLSIDWGIHTDNGGLPGSLITSGSSSPVGSFIEFQSTYSYNITELTLDINDFYIDTGTYWASFHVSSMIGGIFWDINASGIGSADSTDNGVTWSLGYGDGDINDNVTFGVDGASVVPVPAAAWLFGYGLIGLFGVARRKKCL